VRMVSEHGGEYPSQWAAIRSIASKMGCTAEALRRWGRQTERDRGERAGLSTSERERFKELERENREPKRADEILRTASARLGRALGKTGHVREPHPYGVSRSHRREVGGLGLGVQLWHADPRRARCRGHDAPPWPTKPSCYPPWKPLP
jgi:transposase